MTGQTTLMQPYMLGPCPQADTWMAVRYLADINTLFSESHICQLLLQQWPSSIPVKPIIIGITTSCYAVLC